MLANKLDVVHVKFKGKKKIAHYHPTHDEKQRSRLRKLVENPPHNVEYWKIWAHQEKEHDTKGKAKSTKKLPKGQRTLKGTLDLDSVFE